MSGFERIVESSIVPMVLSIIVVGLLAGCAGTAPHDQRTGQIYRQHAGMDTEQVRFSSVRSWLPVGDDAVMIEFGGNRHYLFDLVGPCTMDLRHSINMRVLNRSSGLVNRFDQIRIGDQDCRIQTIRPLDFDAVKADLARLRDEPESTRENVEADSIHSDDLSGET